MSTRIFRKLSHLGKSYDCFRRHWLSDFCPECTSYINCEKIAYTLVRRKGRRKMLVL